MSSEIEEKDVLPEEQEPPITDIETLEDYLDEEASDEPAGMWIRFIVMMLTILPGSIAGQLVTLNILITGEVDILLAVSAGAVAVVVTLIMWVILFFRAIYHAAGAKFAFTTDYEGTKVKARRLRIEAIRTTVVPARRDIDKKYKRFNMQDLFKSINVTIKRMATEQTVITKTLEERGFEVHPRDQELEPSPDEEIVEIIEGTRKSRLWDALREGKGKLIAAIISTISIFIIAGTMAFWLPSLTMIWWIIIFTPEGNIGGIILIGTFLFFIGTIFFIRRKFKSTRELVTDKELEELANG